MVPISYAASIPTFTIISGSVTIDGLPAPIGTTIQAFIIGDADPLFPDGFVTLTSSGTYSLIVTGDYFLDTGKQITFKVNGAPAGEIAVFSNMGMITVDLNVGSCPDADSDGYSPNGGLCGLVDCNDNNSDINPSRTETCNGVDDNCNSNVDENQGGCSGDTPFCSSAGCVQCAANSDCSDGVDCTDDICASNQCQHTANDNNCVDREAIGSCTNNPDNNQYTWDYAPKVEGVCDPVLDCQLGDYDFTHSCDNEACEAQCEAANDCIDKCTGESHKLYEFLGCNGCSCSYKTTGAVCVKGRCGAECTPATQTIDCVCTEQDYCDGTTLVQYNDYSTCGTSGAQGCLCQPCAPTRIDNAPQCEIACDESSDCNDDNDCTDDLCINPGTQQSECQHNNNAAQCDDGNACTTNDQCSNGTCQASQISCDDGNICTDDSCNPLTGCSNQFNTAPCSDGLFCTINDVCSQGTCSGVANSCSDSIGCTVDSCNENTDSCSNSANDMLCDNGAWCDGSEKCNAVLGCMPGTANCNDNVDCTVDLCDESEDECAHTPDNNLCSDRQGVEGCSYDNNPYTYDIAPKVEGVCDPILDCQLADYQFTYACDVSNCQAECDSSHICPNTQCTNIDGCYNNIYIDYTDAVNTCKIDCTCEVNTCTQTTEVDNDLDGYSVSCGDCDDTNAAKNSGLSESCDGIDNDCDGSIDEEFAELGNSCTISTGVCSNTGVYVCNQEKTGVTCNAEPITLYEETCDGIDNNCDGNVDEKFERLGQACFAGIGECKTDGTFVCSQDGLSDICSAEPELPRDEICDGLDNDCDNQIDESLTTAYYQDLDEDGFGNPLVFQVLCSMPLGYTLNSDDCNDNDALIKPGAIESCNQIDDDCNGAIDDGLDADNDEISDCNDNCLMLFNPDQLNSDGDLVGNPCDNDDDNDNITDNLDFYPTIPTSHREDVNGDNNVDIVDMMLIRQVFKSEPGDPNWNILYDLNGDGRISMIDLVMARGAFTD